MPRFHSERSPGRAGVQPLAAPSPGSTFLAALVLSSLLPVALAPAQRYQQAEVSLFSVPRSQDQNYELSQSRRELAEALTAEGPRARSLMEAAVERLHKLIRADPFGVVQVGVDRHHGLYRVVLDTLRNLTPEAQEVYESLVRREGGFLLRRPLTELGHEQLMDLAERFPASRAGRRARRFLGDRALEAGRGGEATQHYLAALDATNPRSEEADALIEQMQVAMVLSHPAQYAVHTPPGVDPNIVRKVMEVLPGGDQTWPNYAGGGAGTRVMDVPAGTPAVKKRLSLGAPGFDSNNFAMHAVGDLGAVYISNGQRIYAVSPLGGEVVWVAVGGMDSQNRFGNRGVVNSDMVLSASVSGDVVVAALQVPDDDENITYRRNGMAIVAPIPERRLFAFDRATGKRIWAHWDHLNGPLDRKFRKQIPCGPPLVHGDTIYVPTHDPTGTIAFYLAAYDLHTGEPKWRHLLCSSQQEVNMFGNANMEFASSPLALDGGILYGATNLGLCFAADAANGRIRWLSAYDVVPLRRGRGRNRGMRNVYFANNSPVVTAGVAAFTPLDSFNAMGFDTDGGELLWRMSYDTKAPGDNQVRWLLGAVDDEFIFSGLGVVAVRAQPTTGGLRAEVREIKGPIAGSHYLSFAVPRGAIAGGLIYHPLTSGLKIFDFHGNPDPELLEQPGLPARLGNLLMVDGILVSVASDDVFITYDRDSLLRRAQNRAEQKPRDPLARYQRAALLSAASQKNVEGARGDEAVRVYREALKLAEAQGLGPGSPLWNRVSRELFELNIKRGASLARRAPTEALDDLRETREDAPDKDAWLRVQNLILQFSRPRPAEYLAELDLMASRFGRELHSFPEVGKVPVQAYALWLGTKVEEEPEQAVLRAQEILESFPNEQFQFLPDQPLAQSLQNLASRRLEDLLAKFGEEVYAPIEMRAEQALGTAGSDPELLNIVATRFPHSRSADRAMSLLLDLYAENGDLGAAADAYAKAVASGQASPGLLRRMMVAAERGGNRQLAASIANLILAEHGEKISDFPPDGGRTYRDVVAAPQRSPIAVAPPQLPAVIRGEIKPRAPGSDLRFLPLTLAEGFSAPDNPPLYAAVNQEQLQAFDLDERGAPGNTPLFKAKMYYTDGVLLCDTTLVVPDMKRVRGLHYRTGDPLWELAAEEDRLLESLGIHDGVLHLFSVHRAYADGGELLGVEPLTGHVLFRRVFPPLRASTPPRFTGGQLLVVESYAASEDAWIHRIDPVTGQTTARIPLLPDLRRQMDLTMNIIRMAPFVNRLFADRDTVYVPVNSRSAMGPPRLAALRHDGSTRWTWVGASQRELLMHGLRDDRVVIVEGAAPVGSRIVVLNARSGDPLLERSLSGRAKVLNWDPSAEVPAALLVTDRNRNLRLTCLSLTNHIKSFQHSLHPQDWKVLLPPILGDTFVAFGVTRQGSSALRLYALDLRNRQGALPDSNRYLVLPSSIRPPYEIDRHGPYTVLQSSDALTIFGNPTRPK